ncbi:MAG: ribosomal protein S18-alanine N-acetyltransferase [Pyrinomonadaceae bacterium]|nr:ribosomal protein S18-alanine N-acetyltransferase [Pyrinomonadaceae bacterium]
MQKIRNIFLDAEFAEVEIPAPAAPTSYSLSTLTEKNLREVLSLNLRCFYQGENYTKLTFKHLLTEPNILSYQIITAERQMVGFIFIAVHNDKIGHITTIGVAPEHRNRGLAKLLLQHAEKALKTRGFDSVVLEVRVSNYIAQNLYHQLDYNIIQKLENYYTNKEDAYLMSKSL